MTWMKFQYLERMEKEERRENPEQTEITKETEKQQTNLFLFVPLFPSVPYSLFCIRRH